MSRDEIFAMVQNQCTMGQLEGVLARMKDDGQLDTAEDNNHFYLVVQ